jgi:signal transduction histidine kinase
LGDSQQRFVNYLHAVSQFDGIGIGLATVRAIIERHHGKVWADSIADQRTTFYFTLG